MLLESPVSDIIDGIPSVLSEGGSNLRLISTGNHLKVESNELIKNIEIFSINGEEIATQKGNSSKIRIDLPQGIHTFIIRVSFVNKVIVRKIAIRM